MRKKYKMTGFARFLIFLLIFTPIAYFGASYYNGEDPVAKIKEVLKIDDHAIVEPYQRDQQINNSDFQETISLKDQEIAILRERIAELEKELAEARKTQTAEVNTPDNSQ